MPRKTIFRSSHKSDCLSSTDPQYQKNATKLLRRVFGNPLLASMLAIVAAIHFMEEFGDKADPNKMWVVDFKSIIHPDSLLDLRALVSPAIEIERLKAKTIMGHLNLEVVVNSTEHKGSLSAKDIAQWKDVRDRLDCDGMHNVPLFLGQISYSYNKFNGLISGLLPVHAAQMAKAKFFHGAKRKNPNWWCTSNPMTEYVFISDFKLCSSHSMADFRIFNEHIDQDEENTLGLRIEMSDVDKEHIREAGQ